MHRFFLPPDSFSGEIVHIQGEIAHQISHVLRLVPGKKVIALDNQGSEFDVELLRVEGASVDGKVLARRQAVGEPGVWLTLYLSLAQREKFEWMLQKCTELGASSFVPMVTERSLLQKTDNIPQKYPRWQSILREAAEQSRRGRIPELMAPLKYEDAVINACAGHDLALLPWEEEHTLDIRFALARINQVEGSNYRLACMIGPEGGFSADEVDFARRSRVTPVTLGPRILRMETAAIAVTTIVLYELDRKKEA